MKPRDAVVKKASKNLGFRTVRNWPPVPTPWVAKNNGWTVWPKATFDFDRDVALQQAVFRTTLRDCYRRGDRIIFADEVLGLTDELKLKSDLVALWSRGASMGAGLWGATQRPAGVPLAMYSQAHHLFCSFDPDKRSRDRLAEIGGVDPVLVTETVANLRKFEWLYIRRDGGAMCIVDP